MSQLSEALSLSPAVESGRARRRDRRIILSILAGIPFRVLQIISGVLLIPLTYRYLGGARFGLWAAITGLGPVVALADFGIGGGLVNVIAAAMGRDDPAAARRAAASCLAAVAAITALLMLILAAIAVSADWAVWLNVRGTVAAGEAQPTAILYLGCAILLLPLSLAARLRAGLQESFVSNAWDSVGVVAALVAVVTLTRLDAGMAALAFAIGLSPVLAGFGNWVWLLRRQAWLRPRLMDVRFSALRPILRLCVLYGVLAVSAVLANTADSVVAIRVLGPESAGVIAISGKIFGAGSALLTAVLAPLWPAFGEAVARRDMAWIRRTLLWALAGGGGGGALLALGLASFTNQIVHRWVGPDMTIPVSLLAANAVWLTLMGTGTAFAMLLNGVGVIRLQIAAALTYSVVAFGLKLLLPAYLDEAGIVWATVLGYGGIVVPLYARFTWRYLRAR
jgi:O-antigen/teichoic acid export membrane protein